MIRSFADYFATPLKVADSNYHIQKPSYTKIAIQAFKKVLFLEIIPKNSLY